MFYLQSRKKKINLINILINKRQIRGINIASNTKSESKSVLAIGKTSHFPPHSREWFNGGYSFDKNQVKNLNSNYKLTDKIIKGYFNLKIQDNWWQSKRMKAKIEKLSLKKVLISKPEIKLTSDKVSITIFTFNNEKRILIKKVLNTKINLNKKTKIKKMAKKIRLDKSLKKSTSKILLLKRKVSRFLKLRNHSLNLTYYKNKFYFKYLLYVFSMFNVKIYTENKKKGYWDWENTDFKSDKIYFRYDDLMDIRSRLSHNNVYVLDLSLMYKSFSKMKSNTKYSLLNIILSEYLKLAFTDSKILEDLSINTDYKLYGVDMNKYSKQALFSSLYKNFTLEHLDEYITDMSEAYFSKKKMLYVKLLKTFYLNTAKFNQLLPGLKIILSKIYGKKINLNIINIKHPQHNMDISIQSVASKFKNKRPSLKNVMKGFLSKIKVYGSKNFTQVVAKKINDINKTYIYKSSKISLPKNTLENKKSDFYFFFLKKLYPSIKININLIKKIKLNRLNFLKKNLFNLKSETDKINNILTNVKYKWLTGIKIKLAGRLTKRFTASRSTSSVRYKGCLKDLKVTREKSSQIMLRNKIKSNIQYSGIGSKRRIGSFGVKGWINAV